MENDKDNIGALQANEQTFLAWLRTGVEVMAFGFVAVKFALFASQVVGIVLVALGAVMIALSYFRYRKTVRQLRRGQYAYSSVLLAIIAAAILVISSILLACLIDAYFKTGNTHGNPDQEKQKAKNASEQFG